MVGESMVEVIRFADIYEVAILREQPVVSGGNGYLRDIPYGQAALFN